MDVAAVRQLGSSLKTQAQSLQQGISTINALVDELPNKWVGPDAVAFASWWSEQHRPALVAALQAIEGLSQSALNNADDQERTSSGSGATALAAAATVGAAAGVRARGASAIPNPPSGTSAHQNQLWWSSLTGPQQEAFLAAHPEVLGNMDGIPGSVRDAANRARLDDEKLNLLRWRSHLVASGVAPDDPRMIVVDDKIASIKAIGETIKEGNPPPPRQLLLLDTEGNRVKAAVSCGDIDSAKHVAVLTPGLNTTVDKNLEGMAGEMWDLRETTRAVLGSQGSSAEVATVAWIGYEAPQNVGEVSSRQQAEVGAASLAGFLTGIHESHGGGDNVHITAMGHSYGSTTTGLALQQVRSGVVDDAVFFGSPGLGTSNASDLAVPEGHRFVLEASADAVADLHYYGKDPSTMEGMTQLSTERAKVVDVGSGRGGEVGASLGHSQYTAKDSTSQWNMAAVVAGQPALTVADNPSIIRVVYDRTPMLDTVANAGQMGVNFAADVGQKGVNVVKGWFRD